MSLLSSTQGTPERVWSLVKLVEAHEGAMPRDQLLGWLAPAFTQGGQRRALSGELDGQALGAATSLGLVRRESGDYALDQPAASSFQSFADQTHARLTAIDGQDPDYVVLEVFAFVVAEVERHQSTDWINASAQEFADAVEHALGGGYDSTGERRFNSTKLAQWRRWLVFIGLGLELPSTGFYPYVAERLLRELRSAELPTGRPIPAAEILSIIAKRMPYLDGGDLFVTLSRRLGLRLPARRITRVLSIALRDLHDEGSVTLAVRGDATDLVELAADGQHPVKTVQTVVLAEADR